MKKKVAYIEPDDYFPKKLRKKYKLGEYAEDCGGNEFVICPPTIRDDKEDKEDKEDKKEEK